MRVLILIVLLSSCFGTRERPQQRVAAAAGAVSEQDEATPPQDAPPPQEAPAPPARPTARDDGLWDSLASQVVLHTPEWVDQSAALHIANSHGDVFTYVGGRPIGLSSPDVEADVVLDAFTGADQDGDQIPDELDIAIGAQKAALNAAPYGSPYQEIAFPLGDVPLTEGVCTDTVIRSVRNAGYDLQEALYLDITTRPRAFPMVKQPNTNIDHRRVKTLLPYFVKHWASLAPDPDDVLDPWLPGDVIFMQTMGDNRPDHVGVVTDQLGVSAAPLIINNFTTGYSVAAMDIARLAPITHRFRFPASLALPAPHGGLQGLLERRSVEVPEGTQQLLVVTVPGWDSVGGVLQRYRRGPEGFERVGKPIRVTVGTAGLAVGRGVSTPSGRPKLEGDRRAPAGVFTLGTAFGVKGRTFRHRWPYRRSTAHDRFVDDPKSVHYNTWQSDSPQKDWSTAEKMDNYELGLVVQHNTPAKAGAGSAIFLHTWGGDATPTVGCTAMSERELRKVLDWLDPKAQPVLVQLPGHVFGTVESERERDHLLK